MPSDTTYDLLKAIDNYIQDHSWSDRKKQTILRLRQVREDVELGQMSPGQAVARSYKPTGQDTEPLRSY